MSQNVQNDAKLNANPGAQDLNRFRPQDVELLLDQAADLLDRVLRDRMEFYAVGEKLFDIAPLLEQEIS